MKYDQGKERYWKKMLKENKKNNRVIVKNELVLRVRNKKDEKK